MIGDDEEVERPVERGLDPGGAGDGLPTGEAQRRLRAEARAVAEGVDRIVGVEVRVAEQQLVGIFAQLDLFGRGLRDALLDRVAADQHR